MRDSLVQVYEWDALVQLNRERERESEREREAVGKRTGRAEERMFRTGNEVTDKNYCKKRKGSVQKVLNMKCIRMSGRPEKLGLPVPSSIDQSEHPEPSRG